MTRIGTPLSSTATKVLFLGAGELGKEVIIALQRLGVEVIAVDRYADALQRLGPHKTGKSCLYIKNLDGVDRGVLAEILEDSVEYMRTNYDTR